MIPFIKQDPSTATPPIELSSSPLLLKQVPHIDPRESLGHLDPDPGSTCSQHLGLVLDPRQCATQWASGIGSPSPVYWDWHISRPNGPAEED
ncbi:hypothetical protein V6N12_013313 [Hibiscus sabdariffa]|uniref:Uncharacterized protein n=1 Tax=Hibiscus sabdariffa TaxID=183260 RepID=A0ABR2D8X9_9ROSI